MAFFPGGHSNLLKLRLASKLSQGKNAPFSDRRSGMEYAANGPPVAPVPHGSRPSAGKRASRKDDDSVSTLIIDINPCHRHSLLIFNLVIMLVSGALVGGSAYTLSTRWQEVHLFQDSFLIGLLVNLEFPYLAVGVLPLASAAMGFLGALRENVALLNAYSNMMLFAIVVVLLMGGFAAASPFIARDTVHSLVSIRLVEHYRDNEDFQALIDYIQTTFKCCGVTSNGFRDWNHNLYFNCSKDNPSAERCFVPPSCCKAPEGQGVDDILTRRFCGAQVLAMTDQQAWEVIYPRSCADGVLNVVRRNSMYLAVVMLTVFIALMVVRGMVGTVTGELETLTRVYDKYYKAVQKGLKKKLARRQALQSAPRGHLVEVPTRGPPQAVVPVPAGPRAFRPRHLPPAIAFAEGATFGVVPHVARFRSERMQVLPPRHFWDHHKSDFKKRGLLYDPNYRPRQKMRADNVFGTVAQ